MDVKDETPKSAHDDTHADVADEMKNEEKEIHNVGSTTTAATTTSTTSSIQKRTNTDTTASKPKQRGRRKRRKTKGSGRRYPCRTFNGTTCAFEYGNGQVGSCKYLHETPGPDAFVLDQSQLREVATARTFPKIVFLSPSHLHVDNLSTLRFKTQVRLARCSIHAYPGVPNYSEVIWQTVNRHQTHLNRGRLQGQPFVWLVSDYRFGNYTAASFQQRQKDVSTPPPKSTSHRSRTLFEAVTESPPRVFAVAKSSCTNEMDMLQAQRSLAAIDAVVAACPSIRLVFWCLATREELSKRHKGGATFGPGAYEKVKKRYSGKANFVDIRECAKLRGLRMSDLIRDHGGHPNDRGIEFLLDCIEDHEQNLAAKASTPASPPASFSTSSNINDDALPPNRSFPCFCCCCCCWCNVVQSGFSLWTAFVAVLGRALLCTYHALVRRLLFPIQKRFAVIRPRRKLR